MLLKFLTLVLIIPFAVPCPPKENIHPCICATTNPYTTYVECTGIDNDEILRNAVSALQGVKKIYMFTVANITLMYIPHDLFRGLNIEVLEFKNSSVMSYSDTDVALEGLGDSLEKLRFVNCGFMNSWDWTAFKNLNALKELSIIGGDMVAVQEDVREISHLKLTVVKISQTKVSFIDDYAFANFTELNYIVLSHNMITEVKRSMFPDPANYLNEIDLQDNELWVLPEDFFSNMPNLQHLSINKNKFLTLKEQTFLPIWTRLERLYANDNKFRCDCRLKWILETYRLTLLELQCDEPLHLKGKSLEDLQPKDLWC